LQNASKTSSRASFIQIGTAETRMLARRDTGKREKTAAAAIQ
jgi:hypothetical protein